MSGAAELPRLHVVTDDRIVAGHRFLARAEAVLQEGGARVALHLRAPHAVGRLLYSLAAALVPAATRAGALLVVNDRADVARAAGAGGVQLGRRGLSVADARGVAGSGLRVGASVHDHAAAEAALAAGADFVLAGTMYASASHPGVPGKGPAWIGPIAGRGRVIGIGGVTPGRVGEVLRAGGYGVAVIRAVWDEERPHEAVRQFMNALYEPGSH